MQSDSYKGDTPGAVRPYGKKSAPYTNRPTGPMCPIVVNPIMQMRSGVGDLTTLFSTTSNTGYWGHYFTSTSLVLHTSTVLVLPCIASAAMDKTIRRLS